MEFNRPTNIIPAPWAKNGQYETIPATQVSSGRASWDTGFPVENTIPVSSGGIPANYNDFQGVLHDLSEHTCFQQTGGLYLWSSSIDYPVGAVVQGSDNGIYRALAKNGPNTTVANPVTDSSGKWTSFVMTDGNQTISGGLTVTSGISGTVTNASSLGGVAASGYVTTSSDQTISGNKTIVNNLRFNKTATINGVSTNHSATLSMNDTSLNVGFYDVSSSGWVIAGSPGGTTFTDNAFLAQSGATIKNGATISGGLTVTSGATISGGIVMQAGDGNELTTTADNVTLTIAGGTSATDAPFLALVGKTKDANGGRFVIHADNGANERNLAGFPDGTLTWDNKGFVYDSGDQEIDGFKTFLVSPKIERVNPYLFLAETDCQKGTAPSAKGYQGIVFCDKNAVSLSDIIAHYGTDKGEDIEIRVYENSSSSSTNVYLVSMNHNSTTTSFSPYPNNTVTLGNGTYRFKQLYANTATINTSDERIKRNIVSVPDAVLDAWGEVQWQQFQMTDAVEEKGENARLHNGLIAQRIDTIFTAHGLDANRYGLFCHDVWDAQPERRDPDGNIEREALPAGDIYSLRYEEALCMEAAYQRRRADRAEARITALEQRFTEMEAVLASLISPISDEQTAEPEQEGE